jgi:H+/Cl- antiporter ClcA
MREDGCMDRQQFFGDSVARTLVRLVLLSIVVGIIFSVLGITPFNLIERIEQLVRRILDLGFDAFRSAFTYFLLGAVVVIPIWFIMRLLRGGRPGDRR